MPMLPQIQNNLLIQNKTNQMRIPISELFHLGSEGSIAEVFSSTLPIFKIPCQLHSVHEITYISCTYSFGSPATWGDIWKAELSLGSEHKCMNFVSLSSCWLISWRKEQLKTWLTVLTVFSTSANTAITQNFIESSNLKVLAQGNDFQFKTKKPHHLV